MQTLIVPDIHLRWRLVDGLIQDVGADHIIFLGDFFDQFNDTADQNRRQAVWLQGQLKLPNRTFLWGNHDLHYAHPSIHTECSGYSEGKCQAINEVMSSADWRRFQWHCWQDGWLISHAGLHPKFCLRPHLLEAGKLITEKQAERRVLMLVNPARGMFSSRTMLLIF